MPDKTFNDQPMITVVSDSMDPRIKRQLKSQLQSTMMTISEVTAELDNQKAMQDIKAQKDAVKDQTEFDDDNTKNHADPQPIEDNPGNNNEQNTPNDSANPDTTQQNQPDNQSQNQPNSEQGQQSQDDPFKDSSDQSGTNATNQNDSQQGSSTPQGNGSDSNDVFEAGTEGGQQQNANPPAGNQQPAPDTTGQQGQAQSQANPEQNQQAQNNGQQQSQPAAQTSNPVDNSAAGGEDPFNDDNVNFEAFAGILGFNYKTEDASQTDDSEAPPFKNIVYVKGSDAGVDNRTSAIVATIEDPQNTVVILDVSEVAEVEAKLQFKNLTKQLQGRNIMVADSVDQAVEYLNQIYDELSGKAQ